MRPEKESEDMEEGVWDPVILFADIGMLVTEARTPDQSPKGRVEGPHCPPVQGIYPHKCDKHKEQCRKADQQKKLMFMLCKNKIPMRIDLVLFPNCEHGQLEASVIEGPCPSNCSDLILLERWDVQIQIKRTEKMEPGSVTGRVLLQAIRSYLHFSQLSSWLISNRGYLPLTILHRVYAPGESVQSSFSTSPDVHNFPIADLHSTVIKVSVASMPRMSNIPHMLCKEEATLFKKPPRIPIRKSVGKKKEFKLNLEEVAGSLPEGAWSKKAEELRKMSPEFYPKETNKYSYAKHLRDLDDRLKTSDANTSWFTHDFSQKPSQSKQSGIDVKQTLDYVMKNEDKFKHTYNSSLVANTCSSHDSMHSRNLPTKDNDAKPGSKITHDATTTLKMSFQSKPLCLSQDLSEFHVQDGKCLYEPKYLTKRLPSPKVLFTPSSKSVATYYKKKSLDLDLNINPSSSDQTFEDKIMSSDIKDLVKPLNSEDLEAYLTSLSHRVPERSSPVTNLDSIPTTKCKFFIGGEEEDQSGTTKRKGNPHCNGTNEVSKMWFPDSCPEIGLPTVHQNDGSSKTQLSSCESRSSEKSSRSAKCLFKKSLSEPGLEHVTLTLSELNEFSLSPDENLSDLDSTLAKSFQNLPYLEAESVENGGSSDSSTTPTNSLSETKGAMTKYCGLKSHDKSPEPPLSRELTPTFGIKAETSISSQNMCQKSMQSSSSREGTPTSSSREGTPISSSSVSENSKPSLSNVEKCNNTPTDSCENTITHASLPTDSSRRPEGKGSSLCKQLLRKELHKNLENESNAVAKERAPNKEEILRFRQNLGQSADMIFSATTGLPSRSSPAPIKRRSSDRFDYDHSLINTRAIKNALSCSKLVLQSEMRSGHEEQQQDNHRILSTSAPASTNCLLGNFEESVLNGRIEPVGVVEGFTCEIGAGGAFCPKHITRPVTAYFFQLSEDNAPSPYLGHINLEPLGKKGYHIPKCGTVQVTLFNPNKTVVKMFVVMYDLSDMPPNCQTFLRQRTVYMPVDQNSSEPTYLRYLIHLRFASSKSGKIHLHTDIRVIFARDKFEFDPRIAKYELRSFTEGPKNPKFSPKR